MKKIDGVEAAKVSLNQGLATIRLKPGNSLRMDQIRRAVTEQGFTARDAKVTAVGELTAADRKSEFRVLGSNDTYAVLDTPHAPWKAQRAGGKVLVTAQIAAPRNGKVSETMQILTLEPVDKKQP